MNDVADHPGSEQPDPAGTSTTELVTGLVGDARDLAIAHLDGLLLEAKQELGRLASAARSAAIGLALCSIAALLVAIGGAQALATFTALPLWASYLIAAGLFVAIGLALVAVARARRRGADGIPERQLARVNHDAGWVARRTRDAVS